LNTVAWRRSGYSIQQRVALRCATIILSHADCSVVWATPWTRHSCWQWRPHTAAILHALPLSNCEHHLDDNAVHVAVGLRLGASICEPYQCPCDTEIDTRGVYGLSCKGGSSRSTRHHSLNDLVWRGLSMANIHTTKEPLGLLKSDIKWADGLILIPWKNRRMLNLGCHHHRHIGTVLSASDIRVIRSGSWEKEGQVRAAVLDPLSDWQVFGNHYNSWRAGITRSRGLRSRMVHAAACRTHWNGASMEAGRPLQ